MPPANSEQLRVSAGAACIRGRAPAALRAGCIVAAPPRPARPVRRCRAAQRWSLPAARPGAPVRPARPAAATAIESRPGPGLPGGRCGRGRRPAPRPRGPPARNADGPPPSCRHTLRGHHPAAAAPPRARRSSSSSPLELGLRTAGLAGQHLEGKRLGLKVHLVVHEPSAIAHQILVRHMVCPIPAWPAAPVDDTRVGSARDHAPGALDVARVHGAR